MRKTALEKTASDQLYIGKWYATCTCVRHSVSELIFMNLSRRGGAGPRQTCPVEISDLVLLHNLVEEAHALLFTVFRHIISQLIFMNISRRGCSSTRQACPLETSDLVLLQKLPKEAHGLPIHSIQTHYS